MIRILKNNCVIKGDNTLRAYKRFKAYKVAETGLTLFKTGGSHEQ